MERLGDAELRGLGFFSVLAADQLARQVRETLSADV